MGCIAEPDAIELCRKRGDTFADEFTIKDDSSVVIDITGFTFLLTVDPSPEPSDALNNLFQLTGTITDAIGGKVEFAPSLVQADQTPTEYFYDIQMIDGAAAVRTIAIGGYEFTQDITK